LARVPGSDRCQVLIKLYPKQQRLWRLLDDSPRTHIGYGGSRGGGKSKGLRNVVLRRALKYSNTRHVIFRRTFEELWKNHISRLFTEWPFMANWYNHQRHELTLPNGSVIAFGYAHKKGDVYKHQGDEFTTIAVDEATHWTEEDLVFLRTCLRSTGDHDLPSKMLYSMNPGGRGHEFIKRIFVKKEYVENENPAHYDFIQSYCWDNVGWCKHELNRDQVSLAEYYDNWTDEQRFRYFVERTQYGQELNALPETERLQFLMGDWEVFAGQFFAEWRSDLHKIRPFAIPPWWERFACGDWGYSSPACNLWCAISPDEWYELPQRNGRHVLVPPRSVIVYRESYIRKKTTPELGALWAQLNGADSLRYRVMDPSCQGGTEGGPSRIEQLTQAGWPCVPADNDRDNGWSRVRQYLELAPG
jgi:phage terminase large subunit